MTYSPAAAFAAFALGGHWVTGYGCSEEHVVLCVDDAADLETVFTLNAAGVEQDIDTHVTVIAPPGHPEQLFGLTMRFAQAGTEIRLLMWVERMRATLERLVEFKAIMLASRAAFDTLPDGDAPHDEIVALDLSDQSFQSVINALKRTTPRFEATATGWRITVAPDAPISGAIEVRTFNSETAYSAIVSQLESYELGAHLLVWQEPTRREVGAVGMLPVVQTLSSAMADGTDAVDLTPERARLIWGRYVEHIATNFTPDTADGITDSVAAIVAKRLMHEEAAITVFFSAYAFPDDETSKRALETVGSEILSPERDRDYACRLLYGDPNDQSKQGWAVFALTFRSTTKDKLAFGGWHAEGTAVTVAISEEVLRGALGRVGLPADELRISDVAPAFGS
jgi:hypothetical protein